MAEVGCAGACSSGCTGTCIASCMSMCSGNCTTSCYSTCSGNCSGTCSGSCDGCSGCGGSCSYSCSGSCDGTCTACTGSCSGHCDNGCTAANMATFYNNLGADIVSSKIITATNINDVLIAMNRELARRNKTTVDTIGTVSGQLRSSVRDTIRTNLIGLGMASNSTNAVATASELNVYIESIRSLYGKNLVG